MNKMIFTREDINELSLKFKERITNDGTIDEVDKSYIRALFSDCILDLYDKKIMELNCNE
jgi:hypothetical protein